MLDKIKRQAQSAANREGKPMAIFNLSRFNPMYVIRLAGNVRADDPQLVAIIYPEKGE